MKRYKRRLVSSAVTFLIVLAALVFAGPNLFSSLNTDSLKSDSPNSYSTQANTDRLTTPSDFDESKYPDFYRVVGNAVIDVTQEAGRIQYTGPDALGRTGPVVANLAYENYLVGQKDRADISDIKPSGWTDNQKVEIKFQNGTVYHGYFYNRSHLLAHSLGGDDKSYNMVMGTRPQNVGKNDGKGGMQYTEMLAYKYLKNHKKGSIYYIVTPLYENRELVPRSVVVDIRSDDKSIDQEVEIFNVAPGYTIDYATGHYAKTN